MNFNIIIADLFRNVSFIIGFIFVLFVFLCVIVTFAIALDVIFAFADSISKKVKKFFNLI